MCYPNFVSGYILAWNDWSETMVGRELRGCATSWCPDGKAIWLLHLALMSEVSAGWFPLPPGGPRHWYGFRELLKLWVWCFTLESAPIAGPCPGSEGEPGSSSAENVTPCGHLTSSSWINGVQLSQETKLWSMTCLHGPLLSLLHFCVALPSRVAGAHCAAIFLWTPHLHVFLAGKIWPAYTKNLNIHKV